MPDPNRKPRVFLVHGHDEHLKLEVDGFLKKIGCEVVILHEQPNGGRTVIEKFEENAETCDYAVVLVTPDDVARAAGDKKGKLTPRPRQNVILELGYFFGKLGRSKVAALMKEPKKMEAPSDVLGFVHIDTATNWQKDLAKEIQHAGLTIDLKGLLL